jgi:hypothetical protein
LINRVSGSERNSIDNRGIGDREKHRRLSRAVSLLTSEPNYPPPPTYSSFDVAEFGNGQSRLKILEADYRMRLIYAQIKGSCALMGQEILEASDPY